MASSLQAHTVDNYLTFVLYQFIRRVMFLYFLLTKLYLWVDLEKHSEKKK